MTLGRRTFVGAALAATLRAADKPPINIGFLGASYSHAEGKLSVLRESPDFRLVGICETDPEVAGKVRALRIPLLSRDEVLHDSRIQVIAVESPVRDHARDGRAALEAGKHLHLEKAPSDSFPAFQEIVNLARQRNLLLQVGYMWRYHEGINKVLEAAREGWLGPVYLVKATISNQLAPNRRADWSEFPGGIMFELGGHVIDPAVRLMGRPRKVTPVLHTDGGSDKLKDNTVAILEWDRAIGIIQSATMQPDSSRFRAFEVHGVNGSAIVNPIEPPSLLIDLHRPAGPYKAGPQPVSLPPYRRFVDDFAELAAAVRGERKLRVTPDEDLIVEETLLKSSGMA